MAKALGPTARHVVVPNAGHGVMAIGCARDVIYRFVDAAQDSDATAVDAACLNTIPRPPVFQPVSLPSEASKGSTSNNCRSDSRCPAKVFR